MAVPYIYPFLKLETCLALVMHVRVRMRVYVIVRRCCGYVQTTITFSCLRTNQRYHLYRSRRDCWFFSNR